MSVSVEQQTQHSALRRVPTQERNREVVRRILAAAEELLIEIGYDATVRSQADLLSRANVTRGTFYTYFESCESVMEQLSLEWLEGCRGIIDEIGTRGFSEWQSAVNAFTDAFAEFFRNPSVQQLWLHHHLTEGALAVEADTNKYIAQRMADIVRVSSGGRLIRSTLRFQVAAELGDRVLRLAFERDPDGDAAVLDEVKIASRAYISAPEAAR
jgi:AcrR family transcriptional regulator